MGGVLTVLTAISQEKSRSKYSMKSGEELACNGTESRERIAYRKGDNTTLFMLEGFLS